MSKEEIIVGLDIGTTKICAIVGKKNEFGKLEVLGLGRAVSDGVIRGIVTNIDKTINAIEKAVAEAENQAGIDIRVINVGIAGQHIKSSIHHGGITRDSKDDEITIEDDAINSNRNFGARPQRITLAELIGIERHDGGHRNDRTPQRTY